MKMKVSIHNLDKKKVGELELNPAVFAVPLRSDILARVVHWQLAKRRAGTHATKEVGDVQGSTKKIYRQKGTGGARHGSKRATQFRGGGIIFGPVVRDHGYNLPKKIRKLGLKVALSSKLASNQLVILEDLNLKSGKTKELVEKLAQFEIHNALFIDTASENDNFLCASSNIHTVDFLFEVGANVYDILRKQTLFLTKNAINALEARLA